jgi:hypothetical protein
VAVADIVTGVALLILVPVACLVLAGLLGLTTRSDKFDFRQRPETDPPPDLEEVQLKFNAAQTLYLENAKRFLEVAQSSKSGEFRMHFRRWATECLLETDSALQGLSQRIERFPESSDLFRNYLARIAQLRQEVQRDLALARSLDRLGIDRR